MKKDIVPVSAEDTISKVKNLQYDKQVWLYEQSEDKRYRYVIGKRGKNPLICIGVNPSTASPEDLDPTMKTVERIAGRKGYEGYIMLNLYPMRATNPQSMDKKMDESAASCNLNVIEEILKDGEFDIWAAWGTLIETEQYLKDCLEGIVKIAEKYGCHWYTIGERTKAGHPHHPLYLRRDAEMEPFDVREYLDGR